MERLIEDTTRTLARALIAEGEPAAVAWRVAREVVQLVAEG